MYRLLFVPLHGATVAEHPLPLAPSIDRREGATFRVAQVHAFFALRYAGGLLPFAYEADAKVLEQGRTYFDGRIAVHAQDERQLMSPLNPLPAQGHDEADLLGLAFLFRTQPRRKAASR